MEPSSTSDILQSIKEHWVVISAFVAFLVGYVTLRVEFKTHKEYTEKRIDRLEDELKDDVKAIRASVERLLERGN